MAVPTAFDERWSAVLLDDVQLYTTAQQAAFNWFVNAINPTAGVPRWCWLPATCRRLT